MKAIYTLKKPGRKVSIKTNDYIHQRSQGLKTPVQMHGNSQVKYHKEVKPQKLNMHVKATVNPTKKARYHFRYVIASHKHIRKDLKPENSP